MAEGGVTTRTRSLRGPVLLLMASAFAADFSVNCRGLGAQLQAIEWGALPIWLGAIAAAGPGLFASVCLVSGRLSDRIGRRPTAMVALVLACVALTGQYLSTQLWHLVVYSGLFGAAMALFWPGLSAWFSDLAAGGSSQLNRMLGNFNLAWSVGLTLGVMLGGTLWRLLHRQAFLGLIAMLLAVTVGLLFVPHRRRVLGSQGRAPEEEETCHPRNRQFTLVARLANFLSWFLGGVILALLPKLMHLLGMQADQTGVAIGSFYAAVLLFMVLGRLTERWHYRVWPVALPAPLGLAGLALVSHATSVAAFAVACFVAGMAGAVGAMTSLYYSLHGRAEDRATSTAIHETFVGVGSVSGAMVSGILAESLLLRLGEEGALRTTFLLLMVVAAAVGITQIAAWHVLERLAGAGAARAVDRAREPGVH